MQPQSGSMAEQDQQRRLAEAWEGRIPVDQLSEQERRILADAWEVENGSGAMQGQLSVSASQSASTNGFSFDRSNPNVTQITYPDGRRGLANPDIPDDAIMASYRPASNQMPDQRTGGLQQVMAPAIHGPTMGLADDLAAPMAATMRRGLNVVRGVRGLPIEQTATEAARLARTSQQDNLAAEREDHPQRAMALELAGSLIPGAAALRGASAAPTLAGKVAGGVGGGAVGAGVYAAGDAEGSLGERVQAGLDAAPMGAALGGAFPVAGATLQKTNNTFAPFISRAFQRRRGSGQMTRAQRNGMKQLVKAMSKDEGSRAGAEVLLRKWKQNGFDSEWILANGGRQVQRLMRQVASQEDQRATRMVQDLLAEQPGRIRQEMQTALSGRGRVADVLDDIQFVKAERARPLYDRAYQGRVDPQIYRDQLQPFVQSGNGKKALRKAMQLADAEGDSQVIGQLQLALQQTDHVLDVKSLDYFKRGVDELVSSARSQGNNGLARALNNRKREWLGVVDNSVPEYAEARRFYAGLMETEDAMKLGKEFTKPSVTSDEVNRIFRSMNESEREFYRVGVVNALEDAVLNTADSSNPARFINTENMRQKIRALVADDPAAADDFISFLQQTSQVNTNAKAVLSRTGSQTALRQDDAIEFASNAVRAGRGMQSGNVFSWPFQAAGSGLEALGKTRDQETAEALAGLFFEARPTPLLPAQPAATGVSLPAATTGSLVTQYQTQNQ